MDIEAIRPGYHHVLQGSQFRPVVSVQRWAPGTHPHSPIVNHMTAIEVRTPAGSRWTGEAPEGGPSHRVYTPDEVAEAHSDVSWHLAPDDAHRVAPLGDAEINDWNDFMAQTKSMIRNRNLGPGRR